MSPRGPRLPFVGDHQRRPNPPTASPSAATFFATVSGLPTIQMLSSRYSIVAWESESHARDSIPLTWGPRSGPHTPPRLVAPRQSRGAPRFRARPPWYAPGHGDFADLAAR